MVNSSNTDDEALEEDERTHCPLLLTKSLNCKFIGNPEPMVGQERQLLRRGVSRASHSSARMQTGHNIECICVF